jgi:hypothetical protein
MEKFSRQSTISKAKRCSAAPSDLNVMLGTSLPGRCEIDGMPYSCAEYRKRPGGSSNSYVLFNWKGMQRAGQIESIKRQGLSFSFVLKPFRLLPLAVRATDRFQELTLGRMWLVENIFEEKAIVAQEEMVGRVGCCPMAQVPWIASPESLMLIIDMDKELFV